MEDKGPIGMLFDLSFTEFVTTRVIKLLFVLGVIVAVIGTLALIGSAFSASVGRGIVVLLLSPLVFLLYVLFARLWCEMIIVIFRIAENTGRLVERKAASTVDAPPAA